ncbi:MAG TPA: hypothetical protein VKG80_07735 [Trebonia sp.]|nr:hypothetical protein [Trebonia sp.]
MSAGHGRTVLAWDAPARHSPGRLRPCANHACRRPLVLDGGLRQPEEGPPQGLEYEEVFALADGGRALALAARNVNAPWSGTNPPPGPRTSLPVVTRGARRYQHPVHWSHTGPPRHIPAARPNRRGLRPG